jgi:hypothetical protein
MICGCPSQQSHRPSSPVQIQLKAKTTSRYWYKKHCAQPLAPRPVPPPTASSAAAKQLGNPCLIRRSSHANQSPSTSYLSTALSGRHHTALYMVTTTPSTVDLVCVRRSTYGGDSSADQDTTRPPFFASIPLVSRRARVLQT